MIVTITLTGDKALIARLKKLPGVLQEALQRKVKVLALLLEGKVKTEKLNGQVLNRVTGALSRSISHKVEVLVNAVIGRVFSSGDVKYAGIHEYGGKTQAHVILPKKASVLAFTNAGGKQVFARRVNHPGSTMPERSFLRSSLRDMSQQISRELKSEAIKALKQGMHG